MSNFGDSPDIGDSPERTGAMNGTQLSSTIDSDETALSKYEHELERMINENLINGQDLYTQKLFIAFQNAAKAVTKMFRGENFDIIFVLSYFEFFFRRTFEWNSELEYISCRCWIRHNALQR